MFDEVYLKNMSKDAWKKAARFGANYILEMNVEPSLTYSGSMCAMIGLLVGSEGLVLSMQNWIDDIIIEGLNSCPVRYALLPNGNKILNAEDVEILCEYTKRNFLNEINRRHVLPKNIKDYMPIFYCIQSLEETRINPKVL